ncbi:hypothetical protein SLA2020_021830 [Shorea laevis]
MCNYYHTIPYSKTESWKEGIGCCSWDGVSCDNVTGHVIALDLSYSLLCGTFPSNSTLFLLKNLQSLNLSFNDFRFSKIPPEISQFTRLKHLDISYSQFLGQVPAEITHLPELVSLNLSASPFFHPPELILETTTFRSLVQNLSEVRELVLRGVNMESVNPRFFMNLSSSLTTLDLSRSMLRGNFPNSIFRFPNLKIFYLGGEGNITIDLSSSNWSSPFQELGINAMDCGRRLSESIGDLKSLQYLGLECNLEGSIPTSLAKLTQLRSLELSYNHFSAPILASMRNLSQLTSLILSQNNLSGQIPSSLANLTQLSELALSYNHFSGPIPAFIRNLSQLTSLILSHNNLSGQIPSSLANLTQLSELALSYNHFSGPIPSSLANLTQLSELALSYNHFSGPIPSSLTNLTQLSVLALSENHFSGPIPAFIGNLSQLTFLFLEFNILTGQIPSSLANLTHLHELYLSNNQFSGPIPFHASRFSALSSLDLSYNLLNGTLPPWIFTSPFLVILRLNHNQFQGQINQFQQKSLVVLALSNNKLHGSIPNSIANLVMLYHLDLSSNHFNDLVVFDTFSAFQYLETIILSYNNLSLRMNVHANFTLPELTVVFLSSCNLSEFPNFLRHSDGLRSLVLSKSSIPGNIPEWICEKDDLEILDLSHNNISGKIPHCLPKSLLVLNLQANYFDGNIPFGFPKGCGLRNLNLHGNQMEGPLPRSLVNCGKLEVLDIGNNSIKDTFPHWLESLPDLQVLVLRSNKFYGFVQSTKESLSFPKLRVLDLSNNDFFGPLPVQYIENFKAMMDLYKGEGSPKYMYVSSYQYSLVVTMKGFDYELQGILTIFTSIHLSNNKFEGEILDVIGKLSSLKGLNLSHNKLSGPISPSLGNLANLEWLDLSSNELAGKIPDELVSLTQLEVLNLSDNHLVGRIPQGNQFSTFGNDSYEGNLGLCGIPLSKSCNGIGTPPSSFQEKAEFWRFGWRVVVLGYGCGVVFGLLMGYHVFRTGKPKWFVSLFDGQPSQSRRKMRKARRLVQRRS